MIHFHPQGLTAKEWFTEIRKRKGARSSGRMDRDQKRAERREAGKPSMFVSFKQSFTRIFRAQTN